MLIRIIQGRSVALFGEKRIGKTSLLFILRDIINSEISRYSQDLIDLDLKDYLDNLDHDTGRFQSVYLSLQSLSSFNLENFLVLLHSKLKHVEYFQLLAEPKEDTSLSGFLSEVSKYLGPSKVIVVLIDEAEILLDIENNKNFFGNLKSSTQAFPNICFVLSGAELWHKRLKDEITDLINNIEIFYLKRPLRNPIIEYLVKQPLETVITPSEKLNRVVDKIVNWTSCKPFYLQEVCETLLENKDQLGHLPDGWEDNLAESVKRSLEFSLDNFYEDPSLDKSTHKILILLANQPGLTIKQISKLLRLSQKHIKERLDDLEMLDKVLKENVTHNNLFRTREEYKIVGSLIESWGREKFDSPVNSNSVGNLV